MYTSPPTSASRHARLDALIHLVLELTSGHTDLGASVRGAGLAVELHELLQVELGRLEDLDLADKAVLQRVDALRHLLDFLANHLRDASV